MGNLIISGYGVRVGVKHNYIVVKSREKIKEVAPAEVERVLITTSGVTVTSKFLRLAMNYGIDVVVLDSRGFPVARFYYPHITKTVESRVAQYRSYLNGLANEVAKSIAYCKLMNQAGYVMRLGRSLGLDELKEIAKSIESIANDILSLNVSDLKELRSKIINAEAHGARLYWSSIAYVLPKELGFSGRDQDSTDQVNVVLNYGYGILYSECWKAIALAGLDPYAGFVHTERSGKPVLVFDVVEMFRVATVDSLVVQRFRDGWRVEVSNGLLAPKSRAEVVKLVLGGLGRMFRCKYSESYMTLSQWIKHVALELAEALREGRSPRGFIARW